jgi:hypothetical protein
MLVPNGFGLLLTIEILEQFENVGLAITIFCFDSSR